MDYNVLIGGAAGQGMETMASILEKILHRKGFEVFTIRDYMSRVRGGHNFIQVRFGNEKLTSHRDTLDVIIALNSETIVLHEAGLSPEGFILCDEDIQMDNQKIVKLALKTAAKEAGNPKAYGSAAIGALLKLFSINTEDIYEVLCRFLTEEVAEQNIKALNNGFQLAGNSIMEAKALKRQKTLLIDGNEAIALGALAAGCRFYSAYPMTPSTSIMNYLAAKMKDAEIVVEQAEDEIAAINMAIGASYAGARAMTGTSGGGFALMVEGLGLAGMLEIPLVIAEIQRPGPVTGFPTRTEQGDLKFVISASQGEFPRMVIALRNPVDAFYQTVRAFNLADKYQIPVILLGDQYLADYSTTIPLFDFGRVQIDRYLADDDYKGDREYRRYEITGTGISPRIIPGKFPGKTVLVDSDEHDESGHITESAQMRTRMNNKRLKKLEYLSKELEEPEFIGEDDCDILLLAWGSMHGPVSEAVRLLNSKDGKRYGALIFGDIWPLPHKLLMEKALTAEFIINIEQNATGQLASIVREVTGIKCDSHILKYDGRPLSSEEIAQNLKGGYGI
jgi:2-oxoglutarate/2-oxoacid ferredoxin oxidoreductase subunit alpha